MRANRGDTEVHNMKGIEFKVIPHGEQRYETAGDWRVDDNGVWQIRVSKMSDWRYEFLVFFHEIIEMAYCQWHNISEEEVTGFDEAYEARRKPDDESEPGDDIRAPYHQGHQTATFLERAAAFVLHVDWQSYEEEINNL